MLDKKSIATVIKTLERVIGMLENSNDLGELPEITRKRIIEMLNTATMDVYFIGSAPAVTKTDDRLNRENEANNASNEIQKTAVKEIQTDIPENDKFISEEDIEYTKKEKEIVQETVQNIVQKTVVPEQPVQQQPAQTQPVQQPVQTQPVQQQPIQQQSVQPQTVPLQPVQQQLVQEQPAQKEIVQETIVKEPEIEKIETVQVETVEDLFIETKETEIIPEPPAQKQITEDLSDKPLFEWKIDEETNKAKNELEILKNQLNDERKRLEQELLSWQEEKRKKEEEMLAAQKLLEALQQKQQQITTPPVQPQSSWKDEPIIKETVVNKPVEKVEPQPQHKTPETLNNSVGSKKVLYENFETNEFINQISTPISSLPRAIGINDRFRFIKELFGGDFDLYSDTIDKLDKIGSLGAAISYIESKFSWDKNSDSVKQFISLIRRRYM